MLTSRPAQFRHDNLRTKRLDVDWQPRERKDDVRDWLHFYGCACSKSRIVQIKDDVQVFLSLVSVVRRVLNHGW